MTSARDQQIRALYQAALERPLAERGSFVAQLAGADQELRQSVELMLSQQGATDLGGQHRGEVDNAAELSIGTLLGHYRIEGVLGRGGMGVVYRATDMKLRRPVAIKFLSVAVADPQAKSRFRQEAETASALNHPHIVTVYDVGEHDGQQYIVSELVDGGTLDDWSAATRRRGWRQSVELVTGIADAIASAHAAGVLHRDIKPGNVLIGSNGYAKLADFGLAKLVDLGASDPAALLSKIANNTRAGVVIGTIAYMSPEQASGLPLDARSDVFSFGILLYELLAGHRPFEAANDLELLKSIVHGAARPLSSDIPELLRNAVERALEKDPADRYQSMRDLVIELRRIARKPTTASQTALSMDASPRRSPLRWLVASVAVLLVAVIGVALYYGRAPVTAPASSTASQRDFEISQLTTSGNAITPAISPDGKYVAYVQTGVGGLSLWIRQVATANPIQVVPADPGSALFAPTVTPDGSFVDFIRVQLKPNSAAVFEVWRVPFLGGAPRRLVENVWSPIGWSPDGKQMAFVRVNVADTLTAAIIADADGGHERVLTTRHSPAAFESLFFLGNPAVRPAWSPDGRVLALLTVDSSSQRTQVVFVDVATGSELAALDSGGGFQPQGLGWLDAASVVISQPSAPGGPVQLWRMSYPDGAVSRLTNDLSSYIGISLDAQRTNLATAKSETRVALWVGDATASSGVEVVPPTPSAGSVLSIAWAGERVLYDTLTNGRPSITGVLPGGGAPVDIVTNGSSVAATSDGNTIVFMKWGDEAGIWRTDADGRQARELVPGAAFMPVISRDDRQVIFLRQNGGVQSPWTVPIEGGQPTEIVKAFAGGQTVDVSPDGRRLVFLSSGARNGFTVVVCELPACTNRQDLTLPANSRPVPLRWTPDGQVAYLDSRLGNIWGLPLDGSAPRQITHFTDRAIASFAWSRDGSRLAVARMTTTNDIVLLRGLRKQLSARDSK